MQLITVPTINNNDTQALLVEWLKPEGSLVGKGDSLAVLETTKSTYELKSEGEGILHITAIAGREYAFGASLGTIFSSAAERDEIRQTPAPTGSPPSWRKGRFSSALREARGMPPCCRPRVPPPAQP